MMGRHVLTTEEVLEYLRSICARSNGYSKQEDQAYGGAQWRFKSAIRYVATARRGRRALVTEEAEETGSCPAKKAERPRIIVVDDESSIRDLLAKTWRSRIRSRYASDGGPL